MTRKLVIDSDSIINFFKYYSFDKDENGIINEKLNEFIISKIENNEIIVIDKVFQELRSPETNDFKTKVKKHIYKTEHLLNEIEIIFNENLVKINLINFGDIELESELSIYKEKYADLYLIACCEEMKSQNMQPILITEETIKRDKKMVEKIPTICDKKEIECRNLPYLLFTIYKNELIFDLEIKN